jgi:NAD(P)-dependent dehydrogenase (short-subunit alcohol dehydrogenase family)
VGELVLITGTSTGIGLAAAIECAAAGHQVVATMRNLDRRKPLEEAAKARGVTVSVEQLDVTADGVGAKVRELILKYGPFYAAVNNAGIAVGGAFEEQSEIDVREQFETNVFGLMAVTRAFLPRMRERGAGRIVNVSSLGGRYTLPFFGVYNSTKYAVESLSDGLRWELRAFGIDVVLVEPGVIRTNFESTAVGNIDRFATTAYGPVMARYEQLSKMGDRFASEPIVIAKAIRRATEARRPAARYVAPWHNAAMILMSKIVPQRMWDWAMRKLTYLTPSGLGLDGTTKTAAPADKPHAAFVTLPSQGPAARPATHVN